jgi:hypothetical protein
MSDGWIGVDLDGTLAEYHGWKGPELEHIGAPIPLMLERVRRWLDEGREVRIFTARACIPEQVPPVLAWLRIHLGRELPVTNAKDLHMVALWDDRAVQVEPNQGIRVDAAPFLACLEYQDEPMLSCVDACRAAGLKVPPAGPKDEPCDRAMECREVLLLWTPNRQAEA